MIQFRDEDLPLDLVDDPHAPSREAIDAGSLGELTDSIAIHGLLQPIGARGPDERGRYEVVWGHRRTMACRLLRWATIPARVCAFSVEPLEARLVENLLRVDLNPREEAHAIAELITRGKPVAEVARLMRRSIGWVSARQELLTWPKELQDAVASGGLSFAVARLLADVDHERYRGELVAEALRTNANAPTVSVWLAHYAQDKERIIRNSDTIAEFHARRENFVVMCLCESCRQKVDSGSTALLRMCARCVAELREAQLEEDRERERSGQGPRT